MYAIDDQKITLGVVEIQAHQAKTYNDNNWGIFYTPNDFNGARRIENLKRINSWFIDIDKCDKEKVYTQIKASPAPPSYIVETKSGFHCYWTALDALTTNWPEIESRLIYYFNADRQVRDIPRLLRVPGFYHCKDLNNKFLIKMVDGNGRSYKEAEMLFAYKAEPKPKYDTEITTLTSLDGINLFTLLKPDKIMNGERNGAIFKKGVFLKKLGLSEFDVSTALIWLNGNISDPLPESELQNIIKGYHKWTA